MTEILFHTLQVCKGDVNRLQAEIFMVINEFLLPAQGLHGSCANEVNFTPIG